MGKTTEGLRRYDGTNGISYIGVFDGNIGRSETDITGVRLKNCVVVGTKEMKNDLDANFRESYSRLWNSRSNPNSIRIDLTHVVATHGLDDVVELKGLFMI
jgi:hypothetical protein